MPSKGASPAEALAAPGAALLRRYVGCCCFLADAVQQQPAVLEEQHQQRRRLQGYLANFGLIGPVACHLCGQQGFQVSLEGLVGCMKEHSRPGGPGRGERARFGVSWSLGDTVVVVVVVVVVVFVVVQKEYPGRSRTCKT